MCQRLLACVASGLTEELLVNSYLINKICWPQRVQLLSTLGAFRRCRKESIPRYHCWRQRGVISFSSSWIMRNCPDSPYGPLLALVSKHMSLELSITTLQYKSYMYAWYPYNHAISRLCQLVFLVPCNQGPADLHDDVLERCALVCISLTVYVLYQFRTSILFKWPWNNMDGHSIPGYRGTKDLGK